MTELKEQQLFEQQQFSSRPKEPEELAGNQIFNEKQQFEVEVQTESESQAEEELAQFLSQHKKPSRWKKWIGFSLVAGVGLSIAELVSYVSTAIQEQSWLSLGWAGICTIFAMAGAAAIVKELIGLRRLKQRQNERDEAEKLLEKDGLGSAQAFCRKLAQQGGVSPENVGFDRWQHAVIDSHTDHEVITLYDDFVVSQQDKLAQKMITKYANESAMMVAVSPLAILDILLVAWRNFVLIEKIAQVYGVELGYWSRIRLFRLVMVNLAFVGVSDLVADVGMDMVSMDVVGRVSTRVAQGVGVGLLTARLGYKAMGLTRPLPWLSENKPKLSDIRKQLIGQLVPKKRHDVE
ncbi:YcjF family protein [Vibrio sp. SS-MA-C1-2]|uniref:YcjF family protein n=1 Tax=Vibrio sp. SS-MA-C1-2 TaxID=2908646 RepID=UPI001F4450B6|nr:TIGR01620 family protein [Vibrio sp. SS-MA-C1-2]UJF19987.1 YcjF family protein [Vibrio sp. SS-MA-C1-2]